MNATSEMAAGEMALHANSEAALLITYKELKAKRAIKEEQFSVLGRRHTRVYYFGKFSQLKNKSISNKKENTWKTLLAALGCAECPAQLCPV